MRRALPIVVFFWCSVVFCPLSWKKTAGGHDHHMGRIRALAKKVRSGLLVRQVGKTDSWFEVRPREVV